MTRPDTIRVSKRGLAAGLGSFLVLTGVMHLASENVTLTTSYPSPSGIYQRMTVTGNTVLARDNGNVGIRTANPQALLDVNGNALVRGAMTTGPLTSVGFTNNAARTGLQGRDGGGWHWLMSGGASEGVHNALGFHAPSRQVATGPGWTLLGGGGRVVTGIFGAPRANNHPTTIFVPFRPRAAHCSPAHDGYTNSWLSCVCGNNAITLGANSATFRTSFSHGAHNHAVGCLVNFIIFE